MARFLHTADWQIGRRYGRFEADDAAALSDARYQAIETLATLARTHQVDAVLVAGDVFDAQTVSDRSLHRSFGLMAGFDGPWLLLPGNHDAALAEGVWQRARRIGAVPSHVHVLDRPEPMVFSAQGFAVLPAPLTQRQTHADLSDWFDRADTPAGLLRIGLAHGSVTGALSELADAANPIAHTRAQSARLDYLALGDWHGSKRVDARTWYAGTPEPDRFKSNDAGQALIVDISGPGAVPQVQAVATARHRWFQIEHSLRLDSDVAQLLEQLQALPPQSVIDLGLQGQIGLAAHQQLRQGLDAASGRHRSLQSHWDSLQLRPSDDELARLHADGYVGQVLHTLRQRQQGDGPDAHTARQALLVLAGLLGADAGEGGA